jgi:hypothetical protein
MTELSDYERAVVIPWRRATEEKIAGLTRRLHAALARVHELEKALREAEPVVASQDENEKYLARKAGHHGPTDSAAEKALAAIRAALSKPILDTDAPLGPQEEI